MTTVAPGQRLLTSGEKTLLRGIFGNTLNYDGQLVSVNSNDVGGEDNSFTPGYVPNMARHLWRPDYSIATTRETAVFIHEMVHVWQSGHGRHNLWRGVYLWFEYDSYEDAYKYDLSSSSSFSYFNMEQQAAIIEDYYLVSKGLTPDNNRGSRTLLPHYMVFVFQLQAAGPFVPPAGPIFKNRDYVGNKM